jgi:hypothetical protein
MDSLVGAGGSPRHVERSSRARPASAARGLDLKDASYLDRIPVSFFEIDRSPFFI